MPKSSFKELLFAIRNNLDARGEYFSNLTDHPAEKGNANENHFACFLKEFLPKKYKVGTGFIEAVSNQEERLISAQTDIILYDDLENSPLYISDHWGIFPIEIVHAVIEVKTTLKKGICDSNQQKYTELYKSFFDNKKLRMMSKYKTYLERRDHIENGKRTLAYERFSSDLPPRFFIFAYDAEGYQSIDALEQSIQKEICAVPECDTHYHGIYVLKKNWFLYRKAYQDTHTTIKFTGNEAWLVFLNQLNLVIEGVVPNNTKIDRTRYIPELREAIYLWTGGSPEEISDKD
ncbi:MAG: hypothetical protein IT558_03345 [Alphaproteobacteria bacterium]|nr:hypothetical protein [Alphaproteobacteria bacterium]